MTTLKRKPASNLTVHVGKKIRHAREAKDMTQCQLAINVGCGISHLSEVESGFWTLNSETLWNISEELGVDMNYFFEDLG